ncbi:DUF6011 domain-containing protein [Frankia sp. CcI49]|uniref:DUF6011 domain-containing protein n=1 Tax=Frankia sp. CcI49 TaxID=1745382 RepID=UPI000E2E7151|nr:DUF6011 domain-containing protein [Frankia sp. CcI49]
MTDTPRRDDRPRCRMCGHPLTDPRSIGLLLGPECQARVHPAYVRALAAAAARATKDLAILTEFVEVTEWRAA